MTNESEPWLSLVAYYLNGNRMKNLHVLKKANTKALKERDLTPVKAKHNIPTALFMLALLCAAPWMSQLCSIWTVKSDRASLQTLDFGKGMGHQTDNIKALTRFSAHISCEERPISDIRMPSSLRIKSITNLEGTIYILLSLHLPLRFSFWIPKVLDNLCFESGHEGWDDDFFTI